MAEKFISRHKAWQIQKFLISMRVVQARQTASTEAAADDYQEKLDEISAQWLNDTLSYDEFREATRHLKRPAGSVFVNTLPEYRFLLECANFSEPEITTTLAHENAHMLVAQRMPNIRPTYALQFMITPRGFAIRPSVNIYLLDGAESDSQIAKEQFKHALTAPEALSNSNKKKLGLLG